MDWFKRAKELMVVADAMENETPAAQAQMAALDEVLGLGYDYHKQFPDKVRGVTLEQVQQMAHQRLRECVVTTVLHAAGRIWSISSRACSDCYTSIPPKWDLSAAKGDDACMCGRRGEISPMFQVSLGSRHGSSPLPSGRCADCKSNLAWVPKGWRHSARVANPGRAASCL